MLNTLIGNAKEEGRRRMDLINERDELQTALAAMRDERDELSAGRNDNV